MDETGKSTTALVLRPPSLVWSARNLRHKARSRSQISHVTGSFFY